MLKDLESYRKMVRGTAKKLHQSKTIPLHEAQQQPKDLINSVNQSHQSIVINSNAVLLSEADWAAVQETLYLLSAPGMRESIREELATPVEGCDRQN